MQTTTESFITLCCCQGWSFCPNPPSSSAEKNECMMAGYRKIKNTEPDDNLSVHKYSLRQNLVNRKTYAHIRVPSSLHDVDTLRQTTREVQQLHDFQEIIDWNTLDESKQPHIEKLLNKRRSSEWMKMAAIYGYLDVLKYFINKGETINKVCSSSYIWTAVSYGQLEVVEYLADLGLKDKDKSFFIPGEETENEGLIHAAVRSSNIDEDTACRMIRLLLSKGEDPYSGSITPLKLAEGCNKPVIVNFLKEEVGHPIQRSNEQVCDDMPAPLGHYDDPFEPQGAYYGYFPIPPAPPAYDSLEYCRPGTQNFDPPPSYEEAMREVREENP